MIIKIIIPKVENLEIKFINILSELNNNNNNNIFNYLQLKDLILLSEASKAIKSLIEKYYPIRLKIEYNVIKNFEIKNVSLKNSFLKQHQLSLPQENWFIYDLNQLISTILNLSRKTISQIKNIKRLPNLSQELYAPFCLIFNFNSKNEKVINWGWKRTADFIMSDFRFFIQITNIKIENLKYNNIQQARIYLNGIEKYLDKIKRFSPYLYKLNLWCKAVVECYFLIHPYKLTDSERNILFKDDKEVINFAIFMDEIINKFYIFKGFLEEKKLIKTKLGDFIFNFDYKYNNKRNNISVTKKDRWNLINDDKIIGNILSYLEMGERIVFINLNKLFYNGFQQSLNISCYNILKKIINIKYESFNDLYSSIPSIFENNIFSEYFFMLEDIVYPENKNISFLTKDNINYMKHYKGNNELINTICKIFCIICNIKVEKSYNEEYMLVNLYIKSVILLCIKENSLSNIIKYINIFNLNNSQIKTFYEEISKIYTIEQIKKVKNINKGFYQLLLWEFYIFEYIKQFNPFLLIDKDKIINHDSNSFNEKQLNIINDYISLMEKLKNTLKIKYHFQNLYFVNNNNNTNFVRIIKNIIK